VKLSTRRRICRLIFCVACVLPTLLVGAVILLRHTPFYRAAQLRAWQLQLSEQLGLEVELAAVTPSDSQRWLLSGVECRDPESHEWLIRVRSADVAQTSRGWFISLGQPQLNARRLRRLSSLLHEHVVCRPDALAAKIQLKDSNWELQDEAYSESVLNVRSALTASREGVELLVEFRASTAPENERVRMRLARNRMLDPPATQWELQTDSAGLPCSAALPWLPLLGHLGEACVFQGYVHCEEHPAGWNARVQGVFRQVDLNQLITEQFRHKLSGSGTFTVNTCTMAAGRITQLQGSLSCPRGLIGQSLLDAAERTLGLQLDPRPETAGPRPYQQLAVHFSLTAAGLVLGTPASDAGLLRDSQGPLVSLPDSTPRSPLSLVHLLVPHVDLQVPVTRETAAMVRVLPLPELSAVPPAAATADGETVEQGALRLER
jgi:hypothetical protein